MSRCCSSDLTGSVLVHLPENLGHLKKLQYLNLALNNIEVIENLEGQQLRLQPSR